MSFSVAGFAERPESLDDEDIPGFPISAKPEGFTANLQDRVHVSHHVSHHAVFASIPSVLQGHLEKLSTNAKSIHHVLAALCGGLDRLERKIDTSSSQMEARLANIVHHMTGEADEDTMSAWGSLESAGTPAELLASPGCRRSFSATQTQQQPGVTQISQLGTSPAEIQDKVDPGESCKSVNGDLTIGEEVNLSTPTVKREGEKGREQGGADADHGGMGAARPQAGLDKAEGGLQQGGLAAMRSVVDEAMSGGYKVVDASSRTTEGAANIRDVASLSEENDGTGVSVRGIVEEAKTTAGTSEIANVAVESKDRIHQEEFVQASQKGEVPGGGYPRRASNQDDQSDSSNNSARGDDAIVFKANSSLTDETSHRQTSGANHLRGFTLQESVTSGGSDARHVARLRWIWAFGRVCQLIRRRKRKRFEVMFQRATDRTVRMGSRVSVVEKRLDETNESLRMVDRVRDKLLQNSVDVKALNQQVADLSSLLGVEDRFKDFVDVMKAQIEDMVRGSQLDLESKIRSGHEELETRLDVELKRHEDRLDDVDERYEKSEGALKLVEDAVGGVQGKMSAVSHDMAEKERQLQLHEERLKNLETQKKTHQRRLSEIRMKMENAPTQNIILEPEPEETDGERMDRLVKAAGTAAEFLSTDLGKIVDKTATTAATTFDSSAGEWEEGGLPVADKILERLRNISFEAAEFSRSCGINQAAEEGADGGSTGGGGGDWNDVAERAEIFCANLEDILSDHGHTGKCSFVAGERQVCLDDTASSGECSLGDVLCPNGRRDLALRLATVRDALHPVIGERTSAGSLKVAMLRLRANTRGNVGQVKNDVLFESQWRDLLTRMSELDDAVSHIKESMSYDRGVGLDDDDDDDNDTEKETTRQGPAQGVDSGGDLEERLTLKADVSWVQHELQRLWNALDSRVTAAVSTSTVGCGDQTTDSTRPRSAPPLNGRPENPEVAGEESQMSTQASSGSTVESLPPSSMLAAGVVRGPGERAGAAGGGCADHQRRPSFNEGLSLMNNLLRKTSRLEQQMASKADHDEVTRALSSVGIKLRKINIGIPAIEEALSNKIERKDLAKLAALVSSAGVPNGRAGAKGGDENAPSPTVLASRLNSKFRCLSCDRPLPTLGPPGSPKLGAPGIFTPGPPVPVRSPQKGPHLQLADADGDGSSFARPGSPVTTPISSRQESRDVNGWGGGESRIASASVDDLAPGPSGPRQGGLGSKDAGRRRRGGGGGSGAVAASAEHPARLEPMGASATGEQIAGMMSKYPRMMPPPSRIRTAAGGGIGSRPSSAVGGRF